MIILDPYRKIKKAAKVIGIFAGIALVLVLVFRGVQKMRPKPVPAPPANMPKSDEEKQNDMLDAINKANQPAENNTQTPEEAAGKQQEMLDAISKANQSAENNAQTPEEAAGNQQDVLNADNKAAIGTPPQPQPVSPEDQAKSQQDMLNALNAANKK